MLLQYVSTVAQNGQTHLKKQLYYWLILLVGYNPSHFNIKSTFLLLQYIKTLTVEAHVSLKHTNVDKSRPFTRMCPDSGI